MKHLKQKKSKAKSSVVSEERSSSVEKDVDWTPALEFNGTQLTPNQQTYEIASKPEYSTPRGRPRKPDNKLQHPRASTKSSVRGRPRKPDSELKHPRIKRPKVPGAGRGRPRLPDHLLLQPRKISSGLPRGRPRIADHLLRHTRKISSGLSRGRPRKPDHLLKHPRGKSEPKASSKGRDRPRKPVSKLKQLRKRNASKETVDYTEMSE